MHEGDTLNVRKGKEDRGDDGLSDLLFSPASDSLTVASCSSSRGGRRWWYHICKHPQHAGQPPSPPLIEKKKEEEEEEKGKGRESQGPGGCRRKGDLFFGIFLERFRCYNIQHQLNVAP